MRRHKHVRLFAALLLTSGTLGFGAASSKPELTPSGLISRLTHSAGGRAQSPCLSLNGDRMVYLYTSEEDGIIKKSIRFLDMTTGREAVLYADGQRKAPPPFSAIDVLVGSKPPLLSGDGRWVVFTLSLGEPVHLSDHYLAVIPSGGGEIDPIGFPMAALEGAAPSTYDLESSDWERVANFAVSSDGSRIVCLVKGYLGPSRYGLASGIILLDLPDRTQRTLLAPRLSEQGWVWEQFPRSPGTGGGWAFAMSGSGDLIAFGAQNSETDTDFDLYRTDWTGRKPERITRIQDRWINLADISEDGLRIVLFYGGKKLEGLGTYAVNPDGSDLRILKSPRTTRVDSVDLTGDGQMVLHKHIYTGLRLSIRGGEETVAFDERTPGYSPGPFPMDFPAYPSFWNPRLTDRHGSKILLIGPVEGKNEPEIFLLDIGGL